MNRMLVISTCWAICILFFILFHMVVAGSVQTISFVLVIGCLALTAINWYFHAGGRCLSFIFLVLSCVFLSGRAFPVLIGDDSLLGIVSFGDGFEVEYDIVVVYVLLVLTSLFFIHIGSFLLNNSKSALKSFDFDASFYLKFFLLFLPFYLYKNYYYFNYIMSQGGYLSIYQGTEHLEGVGVVVRIASLMCLAAFSLYFFHETEQRKLFLSLIFFSVIFSSELLVGLRGKFFVILLVLVFFYKVKFNKGFSIRELISLLAVIVLLAVLVEVTREQKDSSSVQGNILFGFLLQQGVTAGVNIEVLKEFDFFYKNAGSYLFHQFLAPFYSQSEVQQGWFLANDISMRIQPEAFDLGFATGSSYLAELLLIGGWIGVCIGSLGIGMVLNILSRQYQGVFGAIALWITVGIVYYPRTMLQEPVHNLFRYAVPVFFIFLLLQCVKLYKNRHSW